MGTINKNEETATSEGPPSCPATIFIEKAGAWGYYVIEDGNLKFYLCPPLSEEAKEDMKKALDKFGEVFG